MTDGKCCMFVDKLFTLNHDEQLVEISSKDVDFLRGTLILVTSRQERILDMMRQSPAHRDEYLRLVIEATYTWSMITTVLRMRGAYGNVVRLHDGHLRLRS